MNGSQFFQKKGVTEAMSACELFNAVSGLNIPGSAEDEAAFITEVKRTLARVGSVCPSAGFRLK